MRTPSRSARSRHIVELYAMVEALGAERTIAEWVTLLDTAQIPNAPVGRLEDLFEDPHLVWRQLFRKSPHPSEGEITMVEPPMRLSRTPHAIRTMARRQGEDTRAVLKEAGLSEGEMMALEAAGGLVAPGIASSTSPQDR